MPWRMTLLMMAFVALIHFNRLSMAVAGAEQIIPSGQITATAMGWVYTTLLICYTISMIPGGWLLDRYGPYRSWLGVACLTGVLTIVVGCVGWWNPAPSLLFPSLLIVRGLLGVACAPLHPTAARLVVDWNSPSQYNFANGLVTAAACVGMAFTYVIFGSLVDVAGWPRAFVICGSLTLILAAAWSMWGGESPGVRPGELRLGLETASSTENGSRELASRAASVAVTSGVQSGYPRAAAISLTCLTFGYGMVGYYQYLFFHWAEYYFEHELALSRDASRWGSSFLTLAIGAGMFLGGGLTDYSSRKIPNRLGRALVPVLGLLIAGIATLMGLADLPPLAVIICFAVAMAAVGLSESAYWTSAVLCGGSRGGTAAAMMNTGGNAVGLLAPVLSPWISSHFGWRASLSLAAVICWLAAAAWAGVRILPTINSGVRHEH